MSYIQLQPTPGETGHVVGLKGCISIALREYSPEPYCRRIVWDVAYDDGRVYSYNDASVHMVLSRPEEG